MENKKLGTLLMCLSALTFALMATCVKMSGTEINTFQKLFYRNIVTMIVAYFTMRKMNISLKPNSKKGFNVMILRSVVGLLGAMGYFYAITNMPLADSTMLNKLSPFFVLIFATVFLKEKFHKLQALPMVIVVIGAVLVIRPTFDVNMLPATAGLFSSIGAGAAYTLVRYLRTMEEPHKIVFYFGLVSVIVTFPLMIMFGYIHPTPLQMAALIGAGVFAAIGQMSLSYAYKYSKANEVSIYQYLSILFSVVIGIIVFAEMPDIYSIIGGILIVIAALGNYYITNKIVK